MCFSNKNKVKLTLQYGNGTQQIVTHACFSIWPRYCQGIRFGYLVEKDTSVLCKLFLESNHVSAYKRENTLSVMIRP